MRLAGEPLAQALQQARLADARLARRAAPPDPRPPCPAPAVEQQASSCSRPTSGVRRIPCSASNRPSAGVLAMHREGRDRLGEALRARGRRGRCSSNSPPSRRRVAPATTTPSRARPAPAGGRRGSASRRPPPPPAPRPRRSSRRPPPDPVAIPTRAASWPARGRAQPRHRGGHGEPGAHRPLGLVLVRPRPAEIGQHTVAHELGDVALQPRDLRGDRVLVGPDDLAQLLRVEPPDSAVEPTRSTNITVSCRRSAPWRWAGSAMFGGAPASAISSRLRSPRDTPSMVRSASVSSPRTSRSTSLVRNVSAYRSRPSPRSQPPISTRPSRLVPRDLCASKDRAYNILRRVQLTGSMRRRMTAGQKRGGAEHVRYIATLAGEDARAAQPPLRLDDLERLRVPRRRHRDRDLREVGHDLGAADRGAAPLPGRRRTSTSPRCRRGSTCGCRRRR